MIRRRDIIAVLGGTAVATAALIAARAQQPERMRRIGALITGTENDQIIQPLIVAFREGMAKLGWVEGRNLRNDIRFGGSDFNRYRAYAAELVSLDLDVIVTAGPLATRAMQQQTQTIPIVFIGVGDAFIGGIIENVPRPEGNTTGITDRYASIGSKIVELLKEAVPKIERVALVYAAQFIRDDAAQLTLIEEAGRVLGVQTIKIPYRNAVDLMHNIDAFAAEPNGGLYFPGPPPFPAVRETILRLATQHRLPTISENRAFAAAGGLMSYGSSPFDLVRRATSYVDRILRGARVNELPIEYPTKFELIINLKTAKMLGLTIPRILIVQADEVIE
jgi:putative ABC transport system substrate-binding protein